MQSLILTTCIVVSVFSFASAKFFRNGPNDLNKDKSGTCKLSAFPPNAESMCCGVDFTSTNKIVGGEPTALNQYPWMALIEYRVIKTKTVGTRCGASLISGLYVLTAAHCVAGKHLKKSIPINVVLGDYDKFHNGPDCIYSNGKKICTKGEIRIPIENIKVHPGYDDRAKFPSNDIALIRLSKTAPYTDAIRPICLPSSDLSSKYQENLWLEIAGWGTMRQERVGDIFKSKTSTVKRHLRIPFVNTKECQHIWPEVIFTQICAGGLKGQDACMGDSGGPLMFNNRGQYEVSGIVSYGHAEPCGRKGVPTVYTNVYKYRNWIDEQIDNIESRVNKMNTRNIKKVPKNKIELVRLQ